MPDTSWTLQGAKNQFSRVVAAAERGKPQFVSKRGLGGRGPCGGRVREAAR
jgi:hypothetical protein